MSDQLRLTRAQLQAALGVNHDTIVQFERLIQIASVITPADVDQLYQLVNRLPPGTDSNSGQDGDYGVPGLPGRNGKDGLTIPGMPGADGEDAAFFTNGPAGGGVAGLNQVVGETPSGTINSTDGSDGNGVFTIGATPLGDFYGNPTITLIKTDIGTGVVMVSGIHFNISGSTITYTAGNFPLTGTTHRASYLRA